MRRTSTTIALAATLVGGLLITTPALAATPEGRPEAPGAQRSEAAALAQLGRDLGDKPVVHRDRDGHVRVVAVDPRRGAGKPSWVVNGDPAQVARQYAVRYQAAVGLPDGDDLTPVQTRSREDGSGLRGSAVRLQQRQGGVPVFGAQVVVALDDQQRLLSLSAGVTRSTVADLRPTVPAQRATAAALAHVGGLHPDRAAVLTAGTPTATVFDPAVLQRDGAARLAWQVEARGPAVRTLVLVDARDASVLLAVDQVAEARDRWVCDNANNPSRPQACASPLRTETSGPSGRTAVDDVFTYSGNAYSWFKAQYGRDSYDAAGARMLATVRFCDPSALCPYPNAYWDGAQTTYGDGVDSDDVVAHEWTHAVTEHEAGLIYFGESGAINESMSDVFGEVVDQTNGLGDDSAAVRWLIGEDSSLGVLRDMADPTVYGQPDRRTSGFWYDGPGDNGGVHTNSGVGNKAAYLLSQGGTSNGTTVTAVGRADTARIFYTALRDVLTPSSSYRDLAAALLTACASLSGTGTLDGADCDQVAGAIAATAMDWTQPPPPNDAFGRARSVDTLPLRYGESDTTGATVQAGEPTSCGRTGRTVWFKVVPTRSGTLVAHTLSSGFDTVLAVYTGSGLKSLSQVGCNDDAGTYDQTSRVTWPATAGTAYWVQLGGYRSGSGPATLTIAKAVPNDDAASARAITALPYQAPPADTAGATTENGEPYSPCNAFGGSTWYRYDARSAAPVRVTTTGFDTVVDVYAGDKLSALSFVTCSDDDPAVRGHGSRVQFTPVVGERYYVVVRGQGYATGPLKLVVDAAP